MKNIAIPANKGLCFHSIENRVRVEGNRSYSKIYFAGNTYPLTVAKVLHWFESHLPGDQFLRAHRTHLVNRRHITKAPASAPHLERSTGEKIRISKRKRKIVKTLLGV